MSKAKKSCQTGIFPGMSAHRAPALESGEHDHDLASGFKRLISLHKISLPFGETGSPYVVQTCLELMILLPQTPDYSHGPPCLALHRLLMFLKPDLLRL
jgi:hypothetical protein